MGRRSAVLTVAEDDFKIFKTSVILSLLPYPPSHAIDTQSHPGLEQPHNRLWVFIASENVFVDHCLNS